MTYPLMHAGLSPKQAGVVAEAVYMLCMEEQAVDTDVVKGALGAVAEERMMVMEGAAEEEEEMTKSLMV